MSLEKRSNCGSPYLLMLCVAILFSACNTRPKTPAPPDYGVAYNHVRDSLRLKTISEAWAISMQTGSVILFNNPDIDSTLNEPKAYYVGKTLGIKGDSLLYELDIYGILRFPTPDQGVVLASLNYAYNYRPNSGDCKGWDYSYLINKYPDRDTLPQMNFSEKWEDGRTRRDSEGYLLPMTRAEADSILATWGMKYP